MSENLKRKPPQQDNLYKSRGVLASNEELVVQAKSILDGMGLNVLGPAAVREKLGLTKHPYQGVPEGKKTFEELYPEEVAQAVLGA